MKKLIYILLFIPFTLLSQVDYKIDCAESEIFSTYGDRISVVQKRELVGI